MKWMIKIECACESGVIVTGRQGVSNISPRKHLILRENFNIATLLFSETILNLILL